MILTLEQAKDRGLDTQVFSNGLYAYKYIYWQVIANGINITRNKKAVYIEIPENTIDVIYMTPDGYYHYDKNHIDILKGKHATSVIVDKHGIIYKTIYGEETYITNK